MAVSSGERLIGVEWVLVTLLQAGDAIASGGQKNTTTGAVSPKLPSPSRFFAAMIAYLMLAGAAMFGPNAAKVASRLGAVAALGIALAPPNIGQPIGPGNRPLIMRFLNLLNSYLLAGAVSQPGQAATQVPVNPNTLVPSNPGPGKNTILGPGVLGGVSSSDATSGKNTTPTGGGPTQILTGPGPYPSF